MKTYIKFLINLFNISLLKIFITFFIIILITNILEQIEFFKNIDWKPTLVEVFAGKLDYKKYPFFDRIMIQLIMWMTKGPTDSSTEIEYTNWEKVKDFSNALYIL